MKNIDEIRRECTNIGLRLRKDQGAERNAITDIQRIADSGAGASSLDMLEKSLATFHADYPHVATQPIV